MTSPPGAEVEHRPNEDVTIRFAAGFTETPTHEVKD